MKKTLNLVVVSFDFWLLLVQTNWVRFLWLNCYWIRTFQPRHYWILHGIKSMNWTENLLTPPLNQTLKSYLLFYLYILVCLCGDAILNLWTLYILESPFLFLNILPKLRMWPLSKVETKVFYSIKVESIVFIFINCIF